MSNYTDQEFLNNIINSIAFLSLALPKQLLAIKNCDSEHIFCSDYLAQLIGIDAKEILGKKIWLPLYDNDIEFETIIINEDQTIIKSRSPQIVFKINRFKKELIPYTSIKTPLINPTTNHVVGILIQGFETAVLDFNHYFQKVISTRKENEIETPHLSKREKQVIFLFLANLSSKEIAEMLYKIEGKKISKSTIDSLFNDQLYVKFKVNSRPALYKKLQEMGYAKKIPKELLKSTSVAIAVLKPY